MRRIKNTYITNHKEIMFFIIFFTKLERKSVGIHFNINHETGYREKT